MSVENSVETSDGVSFENILFWHVVLNVLDNNCCWKCNLDLECWNEFEKCRIGCHEVMLCSALCNGLNLVAMYQCHPQLTALWYLHSQTWAYNGQFWNIGAKGFNFYENFLFEKIFVPFIVHHSTNFQQNQFWIQFVKLLESFLEFLLFWQMK